MTKTVPTPRVHQVSRNSLVIFKPPTNDVELIWNHLGRCFHFLGWNYRKGKLSFSFPMFVDPYHFLFFFMITCHTGLQSTKFFLPWTYSPPYPGLFTNLCLFPSSKVFLHLGSLIWEALNRLTAPNWMHASIYWCGIIFVSLLILFMWLLSNLFNRLAHGDAIEQSQYYLMVVLSVGSFHGTDLFVSRR